MDFIGISFGKGFVGDSLVSFDYGFIGVVSFDSTFLGLELISLGF
jgi:hypothetical protein